MITTLLENANFFQSYGLLIIMIALIAIILVFSATRRKKDAKMADDFVNNLKVGDKIKTYSGIYGTLLSLKETPNGKIAVIESGERGSKTTMTIDVFAIYCVVAPTQDPNAKGIELMENDETQEGESVEKQNEEGNIEVAKDESEEISAKKTATKKTASKSSSSTKKSTSQK